MKYKSSKTKIPQLKINLDKLYNPGLVAFCEIWPGNRMGIFSKSKERIKVEIKK